MFNRKKRMVGLDYGYSHIRAVEIELSADGSARLVKWGTVPTPVGALDYEGKVLDPALLSGGLKKVLQESGISTKKAITMIPSAGLVIRNFIMPYMEPVELKEAAIWESAQHLPYPVEEAACDFIPIYRTNPDQNSDTEVILVSAHSPEVETLMQAFHKAKIELVGIDAGPLALARAIGLGKVDIHNLPPRQILDDPLGEAAASRYEVDLESISEAIIDLGSGTTDVSIFRDGYLRVSRSFTIGESQFDEKLAERLEVDLDEARRIKLSEASISADGIVPMGEDRQTQVSQAIQEVAEEMLEEIQRSLDYYRAQNGWIPVDRIVATGGGVKMPGMIEYLSNNLGSQIEVANPLGNLAESADFPPDVEAYSLAIGLALWKVTAE